MHQRIGEVWPFLMSAAQSGSPDVLAAVDQTLATIEAGDERLPGNWGSISC